MAPTLSVHATYAGVILGTAAYMNPEQARGKPVDKRSDIWAFGCVLYEMLTARHAFEGEEITDVLAAVVRAEPDWTIYVEPYPGPGRKVRISTRGGSQPKWRRDGRELFFLSPDGALMSVTVTDAAALSLGVPTALFQTGISGDSNDDQYAVASNGQRFLTLTPTAATAQLPITVVLNWTAAIRQD